jgi:hypothetical protein
MSTTYNQLVIAKIVEPFRKVHGDGDFSLDEMAAWAIDNKLWAPTMKSQIALLRGEISEAMQSARREYKGLKVRQYHCVQRKLDDGAIQTVWSHIDVATPEFMEQSFARRRQAEANRCYQLHSDIIYWNDAKNPGEPLEVLFDFRDDIADRDHARESGEDFEGDDSQDLD